MSNYDDVFKDSISLDEQFDMFVEADEDDRMLDFLMHESDDFINDKVDWKRIENGKGGLGSDLGTDNPSTGAFAPKHDSARTKSLISSTDTVKQDHVIDGQAGKIVDKGNDNIDPENITKFTDKISVEGEKFEKIDRLDEEADDFDNAASLMLEELSAENPEIFKDVQLPPRL